MGKQRAYTRLILVFVENILHSICLLLDSIVAAHHHRSGWRSPQPQNSKIAEIKYRDCQEHREGKLSTGEFHPIPKHIVIFEERRDAKSVFLWITGERQT